MLCTGEGELLEILKEERITDMDMVVSLTNSDETNLVISMYSWSCRIPSVLTYVEVTEHLRLLHKVNIDITVSPVESTALRAMRFIRYHDGDAAEQAIGKFYMVAEGHAEIKELKAGSDFKPLDIAFKELSSGKQVCRISSDSLPRWGTDRTFREYHDPAGRSGDHRNTEETEDTTSQ